MNEKIAAALQQASHAIRELGENNLALRAKLANYERDDKIRGIAHEMQRKGLSPEMSVEEKVASLRTSDKNLEVISEAVGMTSQGVDIGKVASRDEKGGMDAMTYFLTSGAE